MEWGGACIQGLKPQTDVFMCVKEATEEEREVLNLNPFEQDGESNSKNY